MLLGVAGVVVLVTVVGSGGRVVYISFGLIAAGVLRLLRGSSESHAPVSAEAFEQSIGRTGPSRGEQLVGERCNECEQPVMLVSEGTRCRKCGLPIHKTCRKEHRAAQHEPNPGPNPYR